MSTLKNNNHSFKPISDNPIIIDLSSCNFLGEIHLILKEKLGLPEHYGENWDALYDCLDDRMCENRDFVVEIYGFFQLKNDLREYCATMLEIFDDIQKEHANVVFKVLS